VGSSSSVPQLSSSSFAGGLPTKKAPELNGTCKWDRNPPITTTARGSTPSGVSVYDPDNVCTKSTVVYKFADGTKEWNLKTGLLDEWKSWEERHRETYSDVTPTLNCPAYAQTVTLPACPPLEVVAGADHIIDCTGIQERFCKVNGVTGNHVTLRDDECVEINVMGYTNDMLLHTDQYSQTVKMYCATLPDTQEKVSVTINLNGTSKTYSGSYSVTTNVELGSLKLGDNKFGYLCVDLSGVSAIKCHGPEL